MGIRFRSQFEIRLAKQIEALGVAAVYEPQPPIIYTSTHAYTPDWRLPNGILVEAKGWFTAEDKRKLRDVKRAHPKLDIRLVFQSPGLRGANLKWATKNGFQANVGDIPEEWLTR
jgi:hypothetical protein